MPAAPASGSRFWLAWYAWILDHSRLALRKALPALALLGISGLLLGAFQALGLVDPLQNRIEAQYASTLAPKPTSSGSGLPAIALEISAEDLKRYGPLPWSWETLSPVFDRLHAAQVQQVVTASGLTLLFPHASPPETSTLRQLVQTGVLVPARVPGVDPQSLEPLPGWLLDASAVALAFPSDSDGLIRALPKEITLREGTVPTATGKLVASLQPGESTTDGEPFRIYLSGGAERIPTLAVHQLLGDALGAEQLKGSVVALGVAPQLDPGFPVMGPWGVQHLSAAQLLAQTALQVRTLGVHQRLPLPVPLLLVLGLVLAGVLLSASMERVLVIGLLATGVGVLLGMGLFHQGQLLPVATLSLGIGFQVGLLLLRQLWRVRKLLGDLELTTWREGIAQSVLEKEEYEAIVTRLVRLLVPFRPVHSLFLAIPHKEMRWLKLVASYGAQEADIKERRRDFGRDPYLSALQKAEADPVTSYMNAPGVRTFMIPLRYLEQLEGFLVVNLGPNDPYEAVRWARTLSREVAEQVRRVGLSTRRDSAFQKTGYEDALLQLEDATRMVFAERTRIQSVLESMHIGLLFTGALGEIRFINRSLNGLLRGREVLKAERSFLKILEQLSGLTAADVGQRLERLMFSGESFSFSVAQRAPGDRHYRAEVTGLWSEGRRDAASHRPPDGFLLATTDVSEVQSRDRLELMLAGLRDHLTVLQGYAGLLLSTPSPQGWDVRWVEALDARARSLAHFVAQYSVRSDRSDGTPIALEPTDLVALLEEVRAELDRQSPGTLTITAPEVGVTPVLVDREQSRRGLLTLLSDVLGGEDAYRTLEVVVEEGEDRHQRVYLVHALLGLSETLALRLFDPLHVGEAEAGRRETAAALARRLLQEAGAQLVATAAHRAEGTLVIEFPKI